MELNRCYLGDAASVLRTFEDESVHCCVTSPPYFSLRDYNVPGQIGQEEDANEYIARLVDVFSEVYRVLRKDGTCWIVIGDSYAGRCGVISKGRCGFGDRKNLHTVRKGAKEKDLLGIPWMLAFALRDAGWYLRQDIIWAKANPMPAPMKDRCISSHEHILLLSKSPRYYFDYKAIMEEAVTQEDWNPGIRFGGSKYGDSIVGGVLIPAIRGCRRRRTAGSSGTRGTCGRLQRIPTRKRILPHIRRNLSSRACSRGVRREELCSIASWGAELRALWHGICIGISSELN